MGMSTYVIGFIPIDDKYRRMQTVREASIAAGIDIPEEVDEYFNYEAPSDLGVEIELPKECLRKYSSDMKEGYEILVDKLPKNVRGIRFVNSW